MASHPNDDASIEDQDIVDWLAKKYLPFNFFDDESTQDFFKKLNPNVSMPKKDRLRRMVLKRFAETQEKMMQKLRTVNSKLAFTVDGWTSISGKTYYGITVHFIDDMWNLRSATLDFVPSEGLHTGKAIAQVFFKCLQFYGIETKVGGITVDNAAANTTFMSELSNILPTFDAVDGHFRCFAHILNLAVQDVLKVLKVDTECMKELPIDSESEDCDSTGSCEDPLTPAGPVEKIRGVFKKIKYSEQLLQKFHSACVSAGEPTTAPILDVPTRWNSTFDMLNSALSSKNSLNFIVENSPELKCLKMSSQEWATVNSVKNFLVNFKALTTKIEGEKYPTLPMVVVYFNILLDAVEKELVKLSTNQDRTETEETLMTSFAAARDKMLKHYKKSNWVYCAVLILDPHHKVETFERTLWGNEMKQRSIEKFNELFKKYTEGINDSPQSSLADPKPSSSSTIDFDFLYEKTETSVKCPMQELKLYAQTRRCDPSESILNWWKRNEATFPTLARMARDYLAIQATSVPAERLFSKASLTVRKHRNRLNHASARSILCLNSWVQCDFI